MRRLVARLRTVVWTAVLALVSGVLALAAGLSGADAEIVLGLAGFGIIMSNLVPKT